ncbi:MAG: DUF115 domain-containing protein [Leptospiraceae bacterium]|nr:DUF115 domain-containing protein [Leptospiraceae bacterium]
MQDLPPDFEGSIFVLSYYQKNFPAEYSSFKNLLNSQNVNQLTREHFFKLWIRNFLLNIEYLSTENVKILDFTQKILVNTNVLFCGASPILETQIEKIKKYRNKFFLISSDTSASYLISNQIYPNAILSIDAGRGTIFHLRDNIPENTCFLTWLGTNREIFFRNFKKYLFLTTFPFDQILGMYFLSNQPILQNPSLNVAGMARAIAKEFGAQRIIYAGVSLTTQNGKSHCRGTGYENYLLPKLNRKFSFEGYRAGYKEQLTEKNKLALKEIFKDDFSIMLADINLEELNTYKVEYIPTIPIKIKKKQVKEILSKPEVIDELVQTYSFSREKILKHLKI